MKIKFYASTLTFILFFLSDTLTAQNTQVKLPENVSTDWYQSASLYVTQLEYAFYKAEHGYRVTNSANKLVFAVDGNQLNVAPLVDNTTLEDWKIEMKAINIGRAKPSFKFLNELKQTIVNENLEVSYGFADIQYKNTSKGLRQNFIVNQAPSGNGELKVTVAIKTSLQKSVVNSTGLSFYENGNQVMSYEDLIVWDAENKRLPAYMEIKNDLLSIIVDDKNASYPITIDPLNKIPEWTTSANGVLPALLNTAQLQVQALYGLTVKGLGDLDGDGYDDVAIAAPGMADVLTGSGNLTGVGAVFIYRGSATGLLPVPYKVLQPTTPIAGALFGFSIDAGNITADGKPDLVIGAPLDSYQTRAKDLIGSSNVTVTAGKIYIYRSEDMLAAGNPSPFLDLYLDGSTYFTNGVLGLISNVSIEAMYGYSVAVTDDLNGDLRDDIIVGAPMYAGINAGGIKSGAAFVYYSNKLNDEPVQLNGPNTTLLGLPIGANLGGLLFGYSADGVGDFDNDGKKDIAIGAPAGVNLNSLGGLFSGQFLGGSVYVYSGTGTGIETTPSSRLQAASSGLLSNAANLFGFQVKGVRNSTGARNGNILISSPLGAVVSNVLNGLKLKAGQLHVFKKRTSTTSGNFTSDQTLSSSRASSLVSTLGGQDLDVSALYAASVDNMRDINCDGNADIIVGEPLSTNVPLIGANVTGGAAYIYLGLPGGTYQEQPSWSMYPEVSGLLGVNATSLVGYSVTGAGYTNGSAGKIRALVGGPSNTLDFGTGLLDLGNTLNTVSDFAFDNSGLGKSYLVVTDLCNQTLPTKLASFTGELDNSVVNLNWNTYEESNINYYELQRSQDRTTFKTIAMVFAKNESNNSYKYTDAKPATGSNYYRLKIRGVDGTISYSSIVAIQLQATLTAGVIISPNPVRGDIQLRLSGLANGTYYLKLFALNGQLMQLQKINISQPTQSSVMKNDGRMATGIYSMQLTDAQGKQISTTKLMISDK